MKKLIVITTEISVIGKNTKRPNDIVKLEINIATGPPIMPLNNINIILELYKTPFIGSKEIYPSKIPITPNSKPIKTLNVVLDKYFVKGFLSLCWFGQNTRIVKANINEKLIK